MSKTSQCQNYVPFGLIVNNGWYDPWVIKNTWNKFNLIIIAAGPTTPNYASYDFHHRNFVEWCEENVSGLWSLSKMKLYLRDDIDAMAFKLRWL